MKYALRWSRLAVALAALGLVLPRRSMAYLDPGTGSYMLQMLLALIVGGGFAIKVFWKKIVAFFRHERPAESAAPAQQEQMRDDHQHNP